MGKINSKDNINFIQLRTKANKDNGQYQAARYIKIKKIGDTTATRAWRAWRLWHLQYIHHDEDAHWLHGLTNSNAIVAYVQDDETKDITEVPLSSNILISAKQDDIIIIPYVPSQYWTITAVETGASTDTRTISKDVSNQAAYLKIELDGSLGNPQSNNSYWLPGEHVQLLEIIPKNENFTFTIQFIVTRKSDEHETGDDGTNQYIWTITQQNGQNINGTGPVLGKFGITDGSDYAYRATNETRENWTSNTLSSINTSATECPFYYVILLPAPIVQAVSDFNNANKIRFVPCYFKTIVPMWNATIDWYNNARSTDSNNNSITGLHEEEGGVEGDDDIIEEEPEVKPSQGQGVVTFSYTVNMYDLFRYNLPGGWSLVSDVC